MLNRLGNYIDTLYDRRFDPKNIPAQIMLNDLGAIPYEVSSFNRLNGKTARVIPDDPNRTFYYTRTDAPRLPAPTPAPPPQFISRNLAYSCLAVGMIGAVLFTTGIVHASWLLAGAGFCLMTLAVACVNPKRPEAQQPPRNRNDAILQNEMRILDLNNGLN